MGTWPSISKHTVFRVFRDDDSSNMPQKLITGVIREWVERMAWLVVRLNSRDQVVND